MENITVDWEMARHGQSGLGYRCEARLVPESGGGFYAYIAQLPGVLSQGADEETAVANITEALVGVIATYRDANQGIPWANAGKIAEREKGELPIWITVRI